MNWAFENVSNGQVIYRPRRFLLRCKVWMWSSCPIATAFLFDEGVCTQPWGTDAPSSVRRRVFRYLNCVMVKTSCLFLQITQRQYTELRSIYNRTQLCAIESAKRQKSWRNSSPGNRLPDVPCFKCLYRSTMTRRNAPENTLRSILTPQTILSQVAILILVWPW